MANFSVRPVGLILKQYMGLGAMASLSAIITSRYMKTNMSG